jgi:hypothetical protein
MVPPREDHSRTDPAGSKAPLVPCGCVLTVGVAIPACAIAAAADCGQKKPGQRPGNTGGSQCPAKLSAGRYSCQVHQSVQGRPVQQSDLIRRIQIKALR